MFTKIAHLFPRFGKKKTVVQTLEQLEKEIKEFEKYKQKNELNERKYIGALVLYSIVFYIIGAIIYYIYFMPKNLADRFKTSIPFLITPLIIYGIRRFLKWYFIKRSIFYEKKLFNLKEEKKQILEDVKENETYKKAREILERFSTGIDITPPETPMRNMTNYPASPYINNANNNNNNNSIVQKMPPPPLTNGQVQSLNNTTLVNRNVKQLVNNSHNQSQLTKSTPNVNDDLNKLKRSSSQQDNSIMSVSSNSAASSSMHHHHQNSQQSNLKSQKMENMLPPPPSALAASAQARTLLPRPIIAPNRTYFDKLLDFLVGEGPNNRYALICKNCHFHNGMALKEEFEYVAFRCAYCLFYNEARKTKLSVPKLTNINSSKMPLENGSQNNNDKSDKQAASVASLNSSLSSSNSLDDLGTMSEPIISSSSKSTAANGMDETTGVIEKRRNNSITSLTSSSSQMLTTKSISCEKFEEKKEI